MNEIEQRERASTPLEPYRGDYPGRRRRRLAVGLVTVLLVVVLAAGAVVLVNLNNRVHDLESKTNLQSQQIRRLEFALAAQHASFAAAVACLQTAGATEGLCSQLVK